MTAHPIRMPMIITTARMIPFMSISFFPLAFFMSVTPSEITGIPTGQFTSGCQYKPVSRAYAYSVSDADRDRFTQYLNDLFSDKPEALTINAACSMTGYCATTMNRWIDSGVLFAARLFDGPRIPKSALVSFLASDYAFRVRQKSEIHTELIERWLDAETE